MLKKIIVCCFAFLNYNTLFSQQTYSITGTVTDLAGEPLPYASIFLLQSKKGTVTNNQGKFTLNGIENDEELNASSIGFETFSIMISPDTKNLAIRMKQVPVQLDEIIVTNLSASEMLQSAIKKIPDNYTQSPFLTKVYYRAKASAGDSLLYLEETLFNIVKSYQPGFDERYFLLKNRNFRFVENKINWHGIAKYDFVSNAPGFFNARFFKNRTITYLPSSTFENRPVFVISVSSDKGTHKYNGKIYIDMEDLAFIRFDFIWEDGTERKAQYKKIEGKYYLINGHSVYINKIRGDLTGTAETDMLATEISPHFSNNELSGIAVKSDDILEGYSTQEQDTLFWQEHNALLPDTLILQAIKMYEQKRLLGQDRTTAIPQTKCLYTPSLSIIAPSDWTKNFAALNYNSVSANHLVNYALFKTLKGNALKPMLASLAYCVLSVSTEEALDEKRLLNMSGLSTKMNPFPFNSYGVSYLYGIENQRLENFRSNNYFNFMRLHTVRNEGHYVKSFLLEEELAKVDLSDKNNKSDFFKYYFLELLYNRMLNIYNPFKGKVESQNLTENKQPLIIDRDRSWVKSLFEPESEYNRLVTKELLSDEEQSYLKRSAWFSWLNLISPQMLGINRFHIGSKSEITFSLNYLRVPFGEMFEQNIWLTHNRQLHGFFVRQYKNYYKTTLGAGYKLYDLNLFRNFYVSSTLDFWQQPSELKFLDRNSRYGFHVEQLFEYHLLKDQYTNIKRLSLLLGYDYKTKGYMTQSFFPDEKFNFKLGFQWYF